MSFSSFHSSLLLPSPLPFFCPPSCFSSTQALTTSLERKGVLSKLKAELRAHVFEAVQQQGGDLPEKGRPFRDLPQGKLLAGLVLEYLEW